MAKGQLRFPRLFDCGSTEFDLRVGDCVKLLSEVPRDSVDVVVTSPPYNLGIAYASSMDDAPRSEYLTWCSRWGSELFRALKPMGSLFLNVGAAPTNPLLPHQVAILFVEQLGFVLQNTVHWIKSIALPDDQSSRIVSRGHFKPINSRRFLNDCHEPLFHFTKTGDVPIDRLSLGVPYADKTNIARWSHTEGRDLRCRGNVWFIPYQTIRSREDDRPHPATFPIELAENCIKLHGDAEHRVMLDPFLGIGSSAIAAARQRVRRFIGFDVDQGYIETARQRLADMA
jgi:site-specific DNA-methyltransferase (adenine-specific)